MILINIDWVNIMIRYITSFILGLLIAWIIFKCRDKTNSRKMKIEEEEKINKSAYNIVLSHLKKLTDTFTQESEIDLTDKDKEEISNEVVLFFQPNKDKFVKYFGVSYSKDINKLANMILNYSKDEGNKITRKELNEISKLIINRFYLFEKKDKNI